MILYITSQQEIDLKLERLDELVNLGIKETKV